MAHAQKPDFVFRRNGRVHLNRRGRQFSRLLAAEVCASAVVMLDTPCSKVAWRYWLPTPFASFPFTSPPVRHRVPSRFNWTPTLHQISLGWSNKEEMRLAGHVALVGDKKDAFRVLVGRPEGGRQVGRPRLRWEDNIKMALKEVGWGGMDWIAAAQGRDRWCVLVNTVMGFRVP